MCASFFYYSMFYILSELYKGKLTDDCTVVAVWFCWLISSRSFNAPRRWSLCWTHFLPIWSHYSHHPSAVHTVVAFVSIFGCVYVCVCFGYSSLCLSVCNFWTWYAPIRSKCIFTCIFIVLSMSYATNLMAKVALHFYIYISFQCVLACFCWTDEVESVSDRFCRQREKTET